MKIMVRKTVVVTELVEFVAISNHTQQRYIENDSQSVKQHTNEVKRETTMDWTEVDEITYAALGYVKGLK